MRDNKNEEPQPPRQVGLDRPLTIVLVMDTIGNKGNGTSNSALQYAHELERQGHHVRLVGIGAPEYPARVNKVPLVSWVAAKQQMQFAKPSDTLFRTAFAGADVVHLYLPFKFGRCAYKVARSMGIPVTAGFHLQPENGHVFGRSAEIPAWDVGFSVRPVPLLAVPAHRPYPRAPPK